MKILNGACLTWFCRENFQLVTFSHIFFLSTWSVISSLSSSPATSLQSISVQDKREPPSPHRDPPLLSMERILLALSRLLLRRIYVMDPSLISRCWTVSWRRGSGWKQCPDSAAICPKNQRNIRQKRHFLSSSFCQELTALLRSISSISRSRSELELYRYLIYPLPSFHYWCRETKSIIRVESRLYPELVTVYQ